METNRTFNEMMKPAREWLKGRKPEDIARNTGMKYEGEHGRFVFSSLGHDISVSWPELVFEPDMGTWYPLVVLHYMNLADGTPVKGKLIQFAAMKDGMVRGGGFDWQSERALAQLFENRSEEEIRRMCSKFGAVEKETNADLCCLFPFLPRLPLTLKIWFADDEFPLSARLFLDSSADHFLTIEDAVTAGSLLLEELRSR